MARTFRKTPFLKRRRFGFYRNIKTPPCLRKPKTQQTRSKELLALIDLILEGFTPPNRHRVRANPSSEAIPSDWDDIPISAANEGRWFK